MTLDRGSRKLYLAAGTDLNENSELISVARPLLLLPRKGKTDEANGSENSRLRRTP